MNTWYRPAQILEVGRFSHLDKRVQGVSAVQRVVWSHSSPCFSRRSGVYDHTKSSGHKIPDEA